MSSSDLIPEDYQKYYVHKPDPSFSPQRNQAIIEETIQETRKFFTENQTALDLEAQNRIDIISTYGAQRLSGATQKNFKDWAGRELYTKLIGEKLLAKVRVMEATNRLAGNTKYKNFIKL